MSQKYQESLPKPKKARKELRMGFQSPELQERFLHVAKEVPGRQNEAMRIFNYLAISENGNSTPLGIFGNTGCGKTSLITKVSNFF